MVEDIKNSTGQPEFDSEEEDTVLTNPEKKLHILLQ